MLRQIALVTLLAATVISTPLPVQTYGSQGCGKAQTPGYHGTARTVLSGGRRRKFTTQVPLGYKPGTSHPLILDFGEWNYFMYKEHELINLAHGRLGTSDTERDTSLYYNYASSSHYIIVYPQGVAGDKGTAWQGPSYAYPDVNDIQFVSDLLTYLQDNFCVDINRIYASGKSNGGGFLDLLACSNVGDKFAAFAMAAPALYTDTSLGSCGKKRAILSSHGDADTTIPYAGGEGLGGPLPNVGKWVSWWGQRNCVGGVKTTVTKKNGYETQSLSCKGGLSDVVSHYHLSTPAAHCWPNSKGNNYDAKKYPQGCGDSRVVDFTPVVLKWFAKWTLKNSPK